MFQKGQFLAILAPIIIFFSRLTILPKSVCRPVLAGMTLPSISFFLPLSITLISCHLLTADRTKRWSTMAESVEGREHLTRNSDRQQRSVSSPHNNPECQQGNPLGASYSGNMSSTTSGRTCQMWSAREPHEHGYVEVGEHNHCS